MSDGMNNLDWAMAELGKAIGELLSRELKEKDKRIADLETELASVKGLNVAISKDYSALVVAKDEALKLNENLMQRYEAEAKQRDQLDKALRQIQMKVREVLD